MAIKGAPGGDDYHTVWINPRNPGIIALGVATRARRSPSTAAEPGARGTTSRRRRCITSTPTTASRIGSAAGSRRAVRPACRSRGALGPDDRARLASRRRAKSTATSYPIRCIPASSSAAKSSASTRAPGRAQEVSPVVPLVRTAFASCAPSRSRSTTSTGIALYFGANVVFATRDGGHSWARDQPRSDARAPGRSRGARRVCERRPAARHASRRRLRARTVVRARGNDLGRHRRRAGLDHARRRQRIGATSRRRRSRRGAKSRRSTPSRVDDDTAYVAVNRFRLDDLHPYVYVTHDGGATLAPGSRRAFRTQPVNAVRVRIRSVRGLLYAATEERRLRLVRRRRELAIAAARAAAHVGARRDRARQRPGRRDARTRLLDPRRRRVRCANSRAARA